MKRRQALEFLATIPVLGPLLFASSPTRSKKDPPHPMIGKKALFHGGPGSTARRCYRIRNGLPYGTPVSIPCTIIGYIKPNPNPPTDRQIKHKYAFLIVNFDDPVMVGRPQASAFQYYDTPDGSRITTLTIIGEKS